MSNYRIPRAPVQPMTERERLTRQIEKDIADYLSKGGKINVYPPGYSAVEGTRIPLLDGKTGWERELRNPKK